MQLVDKIYVGGRWSSARGAARVLINPATEIPFAAIYDAVTEDIDLAVTAAQRAAPEWAAATMLERARIIARIGAHLEPSAEMLAR